MESPPPPSLPGFRQHELDGGGGGFQREKRERGLGAVGVGAAQQRARERETMEYGCSLFRLEK